MSDWIRILALVKVAVFVIVTFLTAYGIRFFFTEDMDGYDYEQFVKRYTWSLLIVSALVVFILYKAATAGQLPE